jgi:hypothetical protein
MSVIDWVFIAIVIVGIAAALLGLDRYRGSRDGTGSSAARPTGEVFVDPGTGGKMRVWYDQMSGKREYRPE